MFSAIRDDYRAWVELGPGGLEHNPSGWLKMCAIRALARGDVLDTSRFPRQATARLSRLPRREGPRPAVAPFPVPHREAGGDCDPIMLGRLDAMLAGVARRHAEFVQWRVSDYERHSEAIFVARAVASGKSRNGEVAHVHHPQGSLHVHCAPEDAALVVERGWGEMHSLAIRSLGVPRSYLLVYKPRDAQDLEAVEQIVDAAVEWAARGQDS